jgi:hypothetical protein
MGTIEIAVGKRETPGCPEDVCSYHWLGLSKMLRIVLVLGLSSHCLHHIACSLLHLLIIQKRV